MAFNPSVSKDAAYIPHTPEHRITMESPADGRGPGVNRPEQDYQNPPDHQNRLPLHQPMSKQIPRIADPAPLGLAGFAATTFVLSAHNAGWATDIAWVGLALFYGGLAQLLAGMWEFRNNNTFGATAFSTYGGFWLGLATYVILDIAGLIPAGVNVADGLGWILVAFFIFNTYAMIGSLFLAKATFAVFITLEVTFLLLFVGQYKGNTAGVGWIAVGGYFGVFTALFAWYNSAAVLINRTATVHVVPVGSPILDMEKIRVWLARRRHDSPADETFTASKRDTSV